MASKVLPISLLSVGFLLAIVGYFLIGFQCPYSFVSTIMTGRIALLGIFIPYKWILGVVVCLLLYSFLLMTRQNENPKDLRHFADPTLLVMVSIGIASIGFLAAYYPCPIPMDLWSLLALEVPLGPIIFPYGIVLVIAVCILLLAAYTHAKSKRSAHLS